MNRQELPGPLGSRQPSSGHWQGVLPALKTRSRAYDSSLLRLPHRASGICTSATSETELIPDQEQRPVPATLETDVWKYKPPWCQPYSILGTGSLIVAGVWTVSGHGLVWTALASIPVSLWWYLFLVVYPAEFKLSVEEEMQRRRLAADYIQNQD
ncbi:hypothetical protein WJX72_004091 [[Myrmecia] bisecta]|uniref:DUF6737 domain-containing protein n=1 Tax=[Myrmecia] bisecta TaxID=41462 RepID=A0AAW1Q715_9CHLO